MQFLVDPSGVRPGAASWFFLLVVCVLLPVAAVRQHRELSSADASLRLSRMRIYASAIVTHGALLAMVWLVLREQRIDIFPQYRPAFTDVLFAVGAFGIGLLSLLERFHPRDSVGLERTMLIAPRSSPERAAFAGVALSAGFSEQVAYRGVLFILLSAILGSWWIAAVIAATAFGIAHSFQGWKSAGLAALIGLRDHILVGLTGTLVLAIAIHVLHDLVAGAVIGSRVRKHEIETAPGGVLAVR